MRKHRHLPEKWWSHTGHASGIANRGTSLYLPVAGSRTLAWSGCNIVSEPIIHWLWFDWTFTENPGTSRVIIPFYPILRGFPMFFSLKPIPCLWIIGSTGKPKVCGILSYVTCQSVCIEFSTALGSVPACSAQHSIDQFAHIQLGQTCKGTHYSSILARANASHCIGLTVGCLPQKKLMVGHPFYCSNNHKLGVARLPHAWCSRTQVKTGAEKGSVRQWSPESQFIRGLEFIVMGGEEIFQTTNRFQRWKYEKVQVFGLMKSESVNGFILKVPIHVTHVPNRRWVSGSDSLNEIKNAVGDTNEIGFLPEAPFRRKRHQHLTWFCGLLSLQDPVLIVQSTATTYCPAECNLECITASL